MRTLLSLLLVAGSFYGVICNAQAGSGDASAGGDGAVELAEIENGDVETLELSRAERRAQRRTQRAGDVGVASEVDAGADDTASAEGEAAADDDEGLICRRESIAGSHRRVRVCTTREQREEMRRSSREFLRDSMSPRGGPNTEQGR